MTDLTKIQNAVRRHVGDRRSIFLHHLYLETAEDPDNPDNSLAFATPPQWCRAFLRTVGKWRD